MIQGKIKTEEELVVRVVKNCPIKYDDTKRVLLIDADSIVYFATYFPEDSLMTFPTEEEQIEEAKFRITNKLQEIQNNVEEHFNIVHTLMFIAGKNNFRYTIYPEYKANRKGAVKSPIFFIIKDYLIELGAVQSHGAEADDYIIEAAKECLNNCVISSIDKDVLYHSPNIPFYDYRSFDTTLGAFKFISESESRLLRASQVLIGDSTDGIPGAKSIGPAYCKKNLYEGMSDYQFIKQIVIGYLKANKNDFAISKEQIKLNYKLLKLHTQEEIKELMKWY